MKTPMLDTLTPYLPLLIPLAAIQLGLLIAALISIFTHKHYHFGNRILWVLICILINIIGPILYFVLGRSEGEGDE